MSLSKPADVALPIPEEAKLSKLKSVSPEPIINNPALDDTNVNINNLNTEVNSNTDENNHNKEQNNNKNENDTTNILTTTPEVCDHQKHPINLEEFQMKQKLMEEQNRRRKEMITKALADRTKQTTEEAMRLEKIKKEFHALDTRLSLDVSILRKQIDQASLSYAEAEKHYTKIESEFLSAKIKLHKEQEKKEQLTEHLCAIIAHNELRKSKKLDDLMEQLSHEPCKRSIVDGVCEQTGKMLELDENGEVVKTDDDE